MPGSILEDLITLFVVLDPIGSIPIFLNATEELDSRDRPRVALVAVFVALLVLMLFLYCGQYALEAMHISGEVGADAYLVLQEELDFRQLAIATEDERQILEG